MSYSKEYIAGLLEKFMNGESSLEEEKTLHEYFTSATDVPSEWRDYKSMFEYFDAGMPLAAEKSSSREGGIFMKSHRLRNILLAACLAGIAVGIGFAVLAPKQNSRSIDNVVATNIQDSSVSAPETADAETTSGQIPESSSPVSEYAVQPRPALSATTEVVSAKSAEAMSKKPAETASSKPADTAVQEELVRQIRDQVIEIAKQQVRAKMIDAVMASRGYERVLTENGTETYYNEEKTIAL